MPWHRQAARPSSHGLAPSTRPYATPPLPIDLLGYPAWRVIGVKAFIYHMHQQPNRLRPDLAARLCTNPACLASGIHEIISHTFIDCPAATPAIDWLLQTWQQLSNAPAPPPRTAAVLLADDIEAWPIAHRPSGPALDLWTRLRVCVLGSIWQVRCMSSLGCRCPS